VWKWMDEKWQAQWIWGNGEPSPRNEWHCFRQSVDIEEGWAGSAALRLTADSRYVLYVNGARAGRGPVRSWPKEQFYDTYEIGHLLQPGKTNTIAVLVLHFGVSTFYYVRGQGGLLAQLDLTDCGETAAVRTIGTNADWRTSRYLGQHSRAPRMSCQHAFSEYVDAAIWDEGWTRQTYDDSSWSQAKLVGAVGEGPWTKLAPRDIPLLTEETIYPVRVEALSKVKPLSWTTALDIRHHLIKGSEHHANPVQYTAYAATLLVLEQPARMVLGTPYGEGIVSATLNGQRLEQLSGTALSRMDELVLPAGEHLLLVDVSGNSHAGIIHLAAYCEQPLAFRSLLGTEGEQAGMSAFCTLGPFEYAVQIDHEGASPIARNHSVYTELMEKVTQAADLADYSEWLRPVAERFASEADVWGLSVYKQEQTELAVPKQLQQLVIPSADAALIPVYDGWDTEFIIDFGKEYSGYIEFEVEAAAGTVLDMYGFEYMTAHFTQHTYGLDNTLRYICKEGRQRYLSPIRRGFRYLMVTVREAAAPVRLYGVTCMQSSYPTAETGSFQCSDALLNDIWQISQHTTKLCMEDTFVDCPAYEQVFWVGDSRNEALISNYLYGVNDIVKRCLRLVPGSADMTPLLVNQVPSGWSSVIPNWTFFWVIACHEYYLQTADRDFAREMYGPIQETVRHYLHKLDENGLLDIQGWNFLDWSPIDQPNDGIVAHQNMFLVQTLRTAAELALLADDEQGASWFGAEADKLNGAINAHLWDETNAAYLDCIHADGARSQVRSMQTQVVAMLTGVAEGERAVRLAAYMQEPPSGFVQIGSPFMSFFYYEALAKQGSAQRIVDDIRHYYGIMIDNGATTCWEMYPNFAENRADDHFLTRSHCHAWSSAPAYFLGRELLGVRALTPGWTEVEIAPALCDLAWAKGSVPHPAGGRIDVSWKLDQASGALKLDVAYPEQVKVHIRVPAGVKANIRERKLALA
jgi:alpha-L-rhamnosidase